VIDLHGRVDTVRCLRCGTRIDREALQTELIRRNPEFAAQDALSAPDGDADLEGVSEVAAAVTPVPGGVGPVTNAVWSPGLQANIGYVWVPIELAQPGTPIDVESEFGPMTGQTAAIPFVDPAKQRPAQSLRGTVA